MHVKHLVWFVGYYPLDLQSVRDQVFIARPWMLLEIAHSLLISCGRWR